MKPNTNGPRLRKRSNAARGWNDQQRSNAKRVIWICATFVVE
jgi:hypothetical protein